MEIARERFLDDTRHLHVTISLRSRTIDAHSLLTALTPEEHEAVGAALVHALDEVERIVKPHVAARR